MTEREEVLSLLASIARHMVTLADKHPAQREQILRVAAELRDYILQLERK